MKTKNLILGLVAVVFAIGSAFASRALVATYASVKLSSTDEFTCRLLDEQCAGSGNFTCRVSVPTTQQGTITVNAKTVSCGTINHSADVIIPAELSSGQTIYDAQ